VRSTRSYGSQLALHYARYVYCCCVGHWHVSVHGTYLTTFFSIELLNLTNEIDADVLANVMEEFVEIFAEQLVPFAVQLCTQLVCWKKKQDMPWTLPSRLAIPNPLLPVERYILAHYGGCFASSKGSY
jgi:hypothetical protein